MSRSHLVLLRRYVVVATTPLPASDLHRILLSTNALPAALAYYHAAGEPCGVIDMEAIKVISPTPAALPIDPEPVPV